MTISLNSSIELNPKWEILDEALFIPRKVTVWAFWDPQKLIRRPPEAKLKECLPCTYWPLSATPPLKHCYKTLRQILPPPYPGGRHSFWGHKSAVSLFAHGSYKAIIYYCTSKSVSEIWFAQQLSFQYQRVAHWNLGRWGRQICWPRIVAGVQSGTRQF